MNLRTPTNGHFSLNAGFPDLPSVGVHRSRTPYLAAFNGPNCLVHAIEVLNDLGVSLQRARILPDIGRAAEPEVRLYRVDAFENGLHASGGDYSPLRLSINVREDNRLHRFLPLLAVGLPPGEVVRGWLQGRASPISAWDPDISPPPYTPLEGFHRYYLEPAAMAPDWTNQITPAERLALQLCSRFRQFQESGGNAEQIAPRMLRVAGNRFEDRDNPLAGMIINPDASLISKIGAALELVEVLFTQAMLTIATADMLGGFEFVIPFEPPEGREIALVLDQSATPDKVARWYNAYPHKNVVSIHEQYEPRLSLDKPAAPTRWSPNDPGIRKVTERIAEWYNKGGVKEESWDGAGLRYKLAAEPLQAADMLSLARSYLPDFLPNYPKQIFVTGGMNVEGMLLGLISYWLEDGAIFLGMDHSDWMLFSAEQQVILCGLLVKRSSQVDQCAVFETALRLVIDEGIKTWMERYSMEKIALDRADAASPLAQLGFCLPLGGSAALHAPSLRIRIPRDYTSDPEADEIEHKLLIIERLFLPAHISVQHIWEIDWVRLGETAYLKPVVDSENPDLIPAGVRLYCG